LGAIFFFSAVLVFSGCSSSTSERDPNQEENNTTQIQKTETPVFLTELEIEEMYTNPKAFKGKKYEFNAKVFTEPERDSDGVYFQAFADPANSEKNTIIGYPDPNFTVSNGDYIHVVGTVHDEFKGENLFGAKIVAPMILADEITIIDYVTAVAPAIKTVEVNQEIEQHGYIMKLQKIEFAEIETRVYIEITNNSSDTIYFHDFNAKLIQGNRQFETKHNFEADYKEIQSEILPGIKSDGILVFEPIDPAQGDIKLIAEGSSNNWELNFVPFEFVVSIE